MNILNFENYINKTILDRGHSYFLEGNVVRVYEKSENEYIFHIEGNDHYEVVVELGEEGEIKFSECDCPYDFGPVCKHEVAAYFQLFEMISPGSGKELPTKKPYKRPKLQEVLSNLPKEELIKVIMDIAQNDKTLENRLIVKYSNGDEHQELAACVNLIKTIVRKHTGREGFIKYYGARDFVNELGAVLEKAKSTKDLLLATDIALLLLKEAIGSFQYADDSGGDIGDLVAETFEAIEGISIKCKEMHQREKIFKKLLTYTENEIFDGWEDYQVDLLNICLKFSDDKRLRDQLRTKIESMLDRKTNGRKYWHESLSQILLQLIVQNGDLEEAEQFIYSHLHFSSFREKLLNKYIQEKEYHKVVELSKEGEKQDQQYRGLVSRWKKFRYTAYKSLSLIEEQQTLAKELLLHDGDLVYYEDLKELAVENQEEFYNNLKHELKMRKGWNADHLFLKLIDKENDLEELLAFVRDDPSYIESYAEKLAEHFKDETIDIYKEYIKSAADDSSNRKNYQAVCYKIKKYKKLAGKPKQLELINELMSEYRKRPAFVDELEKIK